MMPWVNQNLKYYKTKESSYKGLFWPIYLGEVLVTQADTFFNPNLNLRLKVMMFGNQTVYF